MSGSETLLRGADALAHDDDAPLDVMVEEILPNNVEIIDLAASSDDLSESSSADPIFLLSQRAVHAIGTRPTEYSPSASNKWKGRAKAFCEFLLESSEEDDDVEEFMPPPPIGRPSNAKKPRQIPIGIVHERKGFYQIDADTSPPIHHSIEKG